MDLTSNTQQRQQEEGKRSDAALLFILAIVLLAFVGQLRAEPTLRLELTAGIAKHRLAEEGSWWYRDFETNVRLKTSGFSAGLLWLPYQRGSSRLGLRVGYSDLGIVRSENTFPIFEDGSSRDARVNPNCDRVTLSGCTGKYNGAGRAKGIYFGPAVERDFGQLTLGLEAGFFYYRSSWVAINLRGVDNGQEFWPTGWNQIRWDNVRGYHGTWYGGVNARWNGLFVSFRHYANVHAANTELGKDYIGLTSGPLWTAMVGASLPLEF